MSTAELRANKLYNKFHLKDEDSEVKRSLMILLLSDTKEHDSENNNSLDACFGAWKEPVSYTDAEFLDDIATICAENSDFIDQFK